MRVLLDEQLPRQLSPALTGYEVRTVQEESWAGLKNGELLDRAEAAGFAALVTGDQSLEFQQNLAKRRLGVVVLKAPSNAICFRSYRAFWLHWRVCAQVRYRGLRPNVALTPARRAPPARASPPR